MPTPGATLALTSIFEPAVLGDYLANFRKFRHLDQVQVILIADRKTPPSAWQACQEASDAGMRCCCPSLDLGEHPKPAIDDHLKTAQR